MVDLNPLGLGIGLRHVFALLGLLLIVLVLAETFPPPPDGGDTVVGLVL